MPGYVASMLSAIALSVAIFKLPESYDSSAVPEQRKHLDWASFKKSACHSVDRPVTGYVIPGDLRLGRV